MATIRITSDTDCIVCGTKGFLCLADKDVPLDLELPAGESELTFHSANFGAGVSCDVKVDVLGSAPTELTVRMRDNERKLEEALSGNYPENTLEHLPSGDYAKNGFILVKGACFPDRVLKIDPRCQVIHDGAFADPTEGDLDVRQIVLPDNLKVIGKDAFGSLMWVSELYLPASVLSLKSAAFRMMMGVQRLELSEKIIIIPARAFESTGLEVFDVPNSVLFICSEAFLFCEKLKWVRFFGCPVGIEEDAFDGCESLSKIIVRKGKIPYFKKLLPKEFHPLLKEMSQ